MNISKTITTLKNNAKMSVLSRKNAREVSELYNDISKNTRYKDVKIKLNSRNNVTLSGKAANSSDSISINMDFKNNTQTQIEKSKAYVFTIFHPIKECVQEVRGTLDGGIKRIRTTNTERNANGTSYIKTTDYENYISGNKFRRKETENGVKFFRNVNGEFVEMFTNK